MGMMKEVDHPLSMEGMRQVQALGFKLQESKERTKAKEAADSDDKRRDLNREKSAAKLLAAAGSAGDGGGAAGGGLDRLWDLDDGAGGNESKVRGWQSPGWRTLACLELGWRRPKPNTASSPQSNQTTQPRTLHRP